MKKNKILFGLFIALVTSFVLLSNKFYAYNESNSFKYCINEDFFKNGKIITISKKVRDYKNKLKKEKKLDEKQLFKIIKKNRIDYEKFLSSYSVVLQSEYLDNSTAKKNNDNNVEKFDKIEWGDDEGYIKITTIAYHIGHNKSGNKIYEITSRVDYKNKFWYRLEDRLIIRHGNNSIFHSDSAHLMKGEYHAILKDYLGNNLIYTKPIFKNITPNYSSIHGVDYPFNLFVKFANGITTDRSEDVYVEGNYFIVATNDTVVQTVYIHNESFLHNNLSVSISAYGLGLGISGGANTPYYSTPLTLLK